MQVNSILNIAKNADMDYLNRTNQEKERSFSGVLENQTKETSLEELFQKASDTYGVSTDLLKAVAKQESSFDPNATSKCGAQGLMQLMPKTAESLGVTDAYDPEQNIMGGAKYLSQLLKKYEGNVSYALAAYNAGSNNVAKYGGIPPFKETQNYVAKITEYLETGVTIPDTTVTVKENEMIADAGMSQQKEAETQKRGASTTNSTEISDDLNSVFSYDEYLKFLEIFLNDYFEITADLVDENEEKENTEESIFTVFQEQRQYNPLWKSLNNIYT